MDPQSEIKSVTNKHKKEIKNSSITAKILFTKKNREFVDTIFTQKEKEKVLSFCVNIALYG
tara:strand:+ start:749 stop:931 length:183 start_codon:yes stop_codon:yes gene_type:complete